MSKYIEQCKIQTGNATIPDHSILKCKFTVSNYKDMNRQPQVKCSRKTNNKGNNSLPSRIYNTHVIPIDMFANERSARATEQIDERLNRIESSKEEIDDIYRHL